MLRYISPGTSPAESYQPFCPTVYDHLALVVEADIETVKGELSAAGVPIRSEIEAPLGATGRAPAVYVEDPFGYRIELKAGTD